MATLNIGADLKNYIINLIKSTVRDVYYPIGRTYITMGNEDPNKTIGGTWVKIYGGYLYGAKSSLGSTNYSGWGAQSTKLSIDQMPKHGHWILALNKNSNGYNYSSDMDYDSPGSKAVINYGTTYNPDTHGWGNSVGMQMTGGNQGHTHNIATIDVWIWKRTK